MFITHWLCLRAFGDVDSFWPYRSGSLWNRSSGSSVQHCRPAAPSPHAQEVTDSKWKSPSFPASLLGPAVSGRLSKETGLSLFPLGADGRPLPGSGQDTTPELSSRWAQRPQHGSRTDPHMHGALLLALWTQLGWLSFSLGLPEVPQPLSYTDPPILTPVGSRASGPDPWDQLETKWPPSLPQELTPPCHTNL